MYVCMYVCIYKYMHTSTDFLTNGTLMLLC